MAKTPKHNTADVVKQKRQMKKKPVYRVHGRGIYNDDMIRTDVWLEELGKDFVIWARNKIKFIELENLNLYPVNYRLFIHQREIAHASWYEWRNKFDFFDRLVTEGMEILGTYRDIRMQLASALFAAKEQAQYSSDYKKSDAYEDARKKDVNDTHTEQLAFHLSGLTAKQKQEEPKDG